MGQMRKKKVHCPDPFISRSDQVSASRPHVLWFQANSPSGDKGTDQEVVCRRPRTHLSLFLVQVRLNVSSIRES